MTRKNIEAKREIGLVRYKKRELTSSESREVTPIRVIEMTTDLREGPRRRSSAGGFGVLLAGFLGFMGVLFVVALIAEQVVSPSLAVSATGAMMMSALILVWVAVEGRLSAKSHLDDERSS